jgi:hypothetical protein
VRRRLDLVEVPSGKLLGAVLSGVSVLTYEMPILAITAALELVSKVR